ncbi:hypothetical protein cypCar_00011141 [Cyprinus carpio]|nr:hypothetical protein cypCar_00011141 [Cyprinus carpio]
MDVFGGAPRFLAYPRPVVVQSGTDAVLKCQIGGDPRPAVIWERNSEKIHPEGRYRVFEDGNVYNLIITSVTMEDSGQYICKAKNCIGETYAAATLKVEGEAQEMEFREENKPRFLIKPLSTRVGRGEDAVFSCKLWGNPRPEVMWEKDGKKLNEIFESTHFAISYQDGGWFQLKIFKTRAPDGGVYTCTARNEFGESLAGAVLLVDAGPGHEDEGNRNGYTNGHWKAHQGKQRSGRQVATRLKDGPLPNSAKVKMFAVTEGKHAKFRCYVTGKPKPEILWRKDGRLILSGRRYLLYEDREGYFTLKVLYCKQQDNGVYVCSASNTAGQTLSVVHLIVKEPPVRFKQPLNDLQVWERDLAVLECEVPEDSIPITWYLEDRRLQPGAKYGMEEWGTKRRLTIRDIGVDDDGIYLCEMADGGRSIAEVAVKGTILRKLPRKVDVLEGENAAFCVEVEEEEMDIHWYKDGTELRETHQTIVKSFGRTHILVFVNTTPQDSGLVMFYVGRSKTSSQLRVKAARHFPPSCPIGVQINTERENAALLSWFPAQDSRKNPPSGYIIERQDVGSQEWLQCLTTDSATSVEILGDSVPCEADYRFRICSFNKYGRSGNVEFPRAVHLVPVARIQAPLQDALVPEGQDACFTIELSASVIGTWFLNGNQLQEDERFSIRRSRTHQSLRIRGVRDTDNGAEITFIAYGIRDSAALYIQAPLVKFTPLSEMDRNKFVEVGNPIVLYCELSDPEAPVRWYKNGVELQTMEGLHIQSEGTMRRIVIQSADFSHSGVYSCDATDDVIRFNVEVEAPPVKFSAVPEVKRRKCIEAGCPIVLQCEVSDSTAPVQWYKDGDQLLVESGVDFNSDDCMRTLSIQSAHPSHAGVYSCTTMDDVIKFHVEIRAAPVRFSAVPEAEKNKCMEAGGHFELLCKVSDPTSQVSWFHNNTQLQLETGLDIESEEDVRTLEVSPPESSHSGLYRCESSDDSVPFTVDIKDPPVMFSDTVKDQLVEADYSTDLQVPPPTYLDDPEDEKTKCAEEMEPVALHYEISDSTPYVSGTKDEKVMLSQSKPEPEVQSDASRGAVINHAPKTYLFEVNSQKTPDDPIPFEMDQAELSHYEVFSGETYDDSVQCTVDIKATSLQTSTIHETDGRESNEETEIANFPQHEVSNKMAEVCSYKEGEELQECDLGTQSKETLRALVVKTSEPSHSGEHAYETDDVTIQFAEDLPAHPVRFSALPEIARNKFIEAGCLIILQCEISDRTAQVSWLKDGVELQQDSGLDIQSEGTMRKMIIQSAELKHSGVYSCEAVDDRIAFKVDVAAPPVTFAYIPEDDLHKNIVEQDNLLLCCQVSRSDANAQWYKDGVELKPCGNILIEAENTIRRLIILSAQFSDSGTYTCRAGDSALIFKVNVREPPVMIVYPKEDVHLDRYVPEEIVLSCELSRPNGKVTWFKDGQKLQESENIKLKTEGPYRRLKILHSGVEDSGEYVCDTADDSIFFNLNIKEPPVRIVSPSQSQMELCQQTSERMVLSCEISRPNATVCWYRDGLEVEESDSLILEVDGVYRRLIIPKPTVKDSAEYVCDTADDSVTFFVNIAEPPVRFIRPRKMAYVVEKLVGDTVVLECEVSRPNAEVTWKKDGEEIEENSNITITEDGTNRQLTIHSAAFEDTGQYVCDARDDVMDFLVKIKDPPLKILRKADLETKCRFVASDAIVLKCEISRANGVVSWLKDNEKIEGNEHFICEEEGTFRSLTVLSAELKDSGEYICDSQDDKVVFSVTVEEPPFKFIKKDERTNISAYEEDSVTLRALVNRVNAPVKWQRGHDPIRDDRFHTTSDGNTHYLTINPLKRCDTGEYTCHVESDQMHFSLHVKAMKVKFSKPLDNVVGLKGSDVVLKCELVKSKGDVQWLKGSQEIAPNRHFTIRAEGRVRSLTIHEVTEDDAGDYACESKDERTSATVVVNTPRIVEFIVELHNITVMEGEDATFKCVVSPEDAKLAWFRNGQPISSNEKFNISKANVLFTKSMSPVVAEEFGEATLEVEVSHETAEVQWMRQGVVIHPGSKFILKQNGKKRSLTIHKLTLSDRGTYSCETLHDRTQAKLTVEQRELEILQSLEDLDIQEGQNAVFMCEVSLEDVPGEWFKNGEKIKPTSTIKIRQEGTKHFLLICNVKEDSSGEMKFVAKNLETTAYLEVEALPANIVKPLQDKTALEKTRVILDCTLTNPRCSIRWYKGPNIILPSERFEICSEGCYRKLVIQQVLLEDEGTYSVQVGNYTSSAKLTVEAQSVLMVRELQDVDVTAPADACFECEVSLPVAMAPTWTLNGETLHPGPKVVVEKLGTVHRLTLKQTSEDMGGTVCFITGRAKSTAHLQVIGNH